MKKIVITYGIFEISNHSSLPIFDQMFNENPSRYGCMLDVVNSGFISEEEAIKYIEDNFSTLDISSYIILKEFNVQYK